jgi:hypothetical protein
MSATDAMAAANRRHQSRPHPLRGLGLALAISAAASLAAPTNARALPQKDYVLSNVSAVFGGTRESFSGVFTVGAGAEWYAQFNGSTCSACLLQGIVHAIPIIGNTIVTDSWQITFTNDFSSVTSIELSGPGGGIGSDLTGGAVATGFPLDYTFANASTVLNGTPETITGHFGFDPLTLIQYGADIQLTGGGPYAGAYFYDAEPGVGNAIEAAGGGTNFLSIRFKNNLSSADDPLASVDLGGAVDNAPTGLVCPGAGPCAVAAPEPASLAILGSALGLLFLGPWATRRAARRHAG